MKQAYNTKQLGAIIECLEAHKSESLTVDGVCESLAKSGQAIGRSTVYRRLEQLVSEGKISRFAPEEGKSVTYRFIGSECGDDCHFHLICTECGEIAHTHCHKLEALFTHMAKEHGFKINERKTLLYGICEKCGGAV
ncbi:MAG: transcriptional repressor [Clostridia bacterium]|nr:transcriptional repressor [Clostridia bacterium]